MFKVRAGYTDSAEVRSTVERVRSFFGDIKNFVELMPNIESIHTDGQGLTHWKIRADIPFFGAFSQKFTVRLAEDSDERIEWLPLADEEKNFLRYSVDYEDAGNNKTWIQFSQTVELRRRSATQLHMLAPLAGEALISSEMNVRITEVIQEFVRKSCQRLEAAG